MEQEISSIKKELRLAKFFLWMFALLIIGGIVHKRVFDGADFMMMWHLPGAIFLVLGGKKLTAGNRRRFYHDARKEN